MKSEGQPANEQSAVRIGHAGVKTGQINESGHAGVKIGQLNLVKIGQTTIVIIVPPTI